MSISSHSGLTDSRELADFGARVRRLRVSRGLGQIDLAELLKMSSGSISMVENGTATVSADLVERLAGALDCRASYLLEPEPVLKVSRPMLRAYADASKKAVDAIQADTVIAVEAMLRLALRRVPLQLPLFEGDLSDEDEIERFALEIRGLAGLAADEVVDSSIRRVEKVGVVVLPMDSEMGRHLGMSMWVEDVPVIRVSRSSLDPVHAVPGDRQRFTIAHELGHLVLHHDRPQPATPAEASRVEREAHRFASAFLAPGDAVVADLEYFGSRVTLSTLEKMKSKWGLSIKAFVVRFRQLGVIDDDHARSLYKQISARKWNKAEPVLVRNEDASWLRRSIEHFGSPRPEPMRVASDALGISLGDLSRWTNWTPAPESGTVVDLAAVRRARQGR